MEKITRAYFPPSHISTSVYRAIDRWILDETIAKRNGYGSG